MFLWSWCSWEHGFRFFFKRVKILHGCQGTVHPWFLKKNKKTWIFYAAARARRFGGRAWGLGISIKSRIFPL
jgi:hypothetical protein